MKILKFTLELQQRQVIEMPIGAEIIALIMQHGIPRIWAKVDDEARHEDRIFNIYGTGEELPENPGRYIGTFLQQFDRFVWHVYEEVI
jgi:hypothetical protein